jgi:hypothetical protein
MFQAIGRLFGVLSGWQYGLLAVAGAIVALYFLKLRRTPRRVPSTFLWMRAVEDLHVNSLFQRLRRNLLLFLQLIVIGLVFAAFFPLSCTARRTEGKRYIFLIDNSASMAATDVAPSRLEAAKKQALAIVDQMISEDTAMVMAFADGVTNVLSFSKNRGRIRQRIEAIEQTQQTTSILEALTIAAGRANPGSTGPDDKNPVLSLPADLYIFTDGRFPDVQDFPLGNLTPHFVTIGSASRNLAIAAMSTRLNEERPDQLQVFARVESYSEHEPDCPQADAAALAEKQAIGARPDSACTCAATETNAELFLDGESKDVKRIELLPGESRGLSFDLQLLHRAVLKLQLDVDDDLAVDNTAWTAVNAPRPARVLVVTPPAPNDDPFLRSALSTDKAEEIAETTWETPDFLEGDDYRQAAETGGYDLIIFDRCAPELMPQANTWFIGSLPTNEGFPKGTYVDWPFILDTDRTHPLMHYVSMETAEIARMLKIDPPQGAQTLVLTNEGPALLVVPREGFQDLVMTFELINEGKVVKQGWYAQSSFPVFVFNVLRELGRAGRALADESTRPGKTVTLRRSQPDARVRVEAPDGKAELIERGPNGTYLVANTSQTGVYKVLWPGQDEPDHFAVNLFDANESNIAPRSTLESGFQEVQGVAGTRRERQQLWKYFLLAALGVLLVEWYVYQKRVYL